MAFNLKKKAEENKAALFNMEKREKRAKTAVEMLQQHYPAIGAELTEYVESLKNEGKTYIEILRSIMPFIKMTPEKRAAVLDVQDSVTKPTEAEKTVKKFEHLESLVDDVIKKDINKLSPSEKQAVEAQLSHKLAEVREKTGKEPSLNLVKIFTLSILGQRERAKIQARLREQK